MSEAALQQEVKEYHPIPTLKMFHESPAQIRGCVGSVGSGKTTAAAWELCYYLPWMLWEQYGFKKTKWVIVRNTFPELIDTTQRTLFDWFDWGIPKVQRNNYYLNYPDGPQLEILFRSCDNPKHIKQFKSLEVTGYWIDESIEVPGAVKRMLKTRIGRHPSAKQAIRWYKNKIGKLPDDWIAAIEAGEPIELPRFGIETTNPPDIEHETYFQFKWMTEVPGPIPPKLPLKNHEGFWQPPRENEQNLRKGYYEDMIEDFRDTPDWIDMYVDGKPGMLIQGKVVYSKFIKAMHVAKEPLIWSKGSIYRGWDNSGNSPACVVVQEPNTMEIQVLHEFHSDKLGIVDFTEMVVAECNQLYPDAKWMDWADPAGENQYSKREGGFTSNAQLMRETCRVDVIPSDNNWEARKEGVNRSLGRINGLLIDPGCIRLINGFVGGYHYPEIGNTGVFSDKPEKNRFSHVHDSLQYVLLKLIQSTRANEKNALNEHLREQYINQRDAAAV
ncbi:hypothetical protein LCGC14_1139880 [marine sediment metagenome]|uniref:Phage terminase large subunit N-terminal domain-containing protein n=1 Tax=marine sediment metagenome TaxID=412755 RepID=A0A0F9Q499_9ZZZZ